MIRGVSFEIPQKATNTLWNIFQTVNIEQFYWYVVQAQTEVWDKPVGNDFFTQEVYFGDEFSKRIQEDHFIVFLKLQAYSHLEKFKNITTYKTFEQSDCQVLVLIYDCSFVEVYTKEQIVTETIYWNAVRMDYKNPAYITDQNDSRTKMDIR